MPKQFFSALPHKQVLSKLTRATTMNSYSSHSSARGQLPLPEPNWLRGFMTFMAVA